MAVVETQLTRWVIADGGLVEVETTEPADVNPQVLKTVGGLRTSALGNFERENTRALPMFPIAFALFKTATVSTSSLIIPVSLTRIRPDFGLAFAMHHSRAIISFLFLLGHSIVLILLFRPLLYSSLFCVKLLYTVHTVIAYYYTDRLFTFVLVLIQSYTVSK